VSENKKDGEGVLGENRKKAGGRVVRLLFSAGALVLLAPFLIMSAAFLAMFATTVGIKYNNPYLSLALVFVIIASMAALMIYTVVKAYQEAPRAVGYIYKYIKEDIEGFLEEARKYAEDKE